MVYRKVLTLDDEDIDFPLIRCTLRLLDRVDGAEDLGLVRALGIVVANCLDVLLEIVSESEPD